MEQEVSLVELFNIIKKRVNWILNVALTGLLLSAVYTFFIATPEYSSTTQLLVNRTQQAEVIQRSDIDTNVQLINTYKDIINGPVILDDVREQLELDISHGSLSSQINIMSENNSQVFSISVRNENPYSAAIIANTTATVFKDNLDEIMNVDNVTIISEAVANLSPISPNNRLNLVIGFVFGGMIGVALAFLLEYLDNTIKDEKFIVEELGWTSLGHVSEMAMEELRVDEKQALPQRNTESRSLRSRV